jgi:O-antigen/teichoic acid export membrane protein
MNTTQILRNALSNYGRLIVTMVTSLLLTPFILHRVGPEAFGLWALTQAVAGYFNLAEMGVTSAATRYLSHFRALKDWDSLNRVIACSLTWYCSVAAVVLAASCILATQAGHIFRVSPAAIPTLRTLIVMAGFIAALGFVSTLNIQTVIAAQRIDALNVRMLAIQILAALLTVVGLCLHAGIVLLVWIQLASGVMNAYFGIMLSRKFVPEAHFRPGWDREHGKMIFSFAGLSMLIFAAARIIYYTDTIIISTFLSVALVAGYAVALKLIELMRSMVGAGHSVLGTFAGEQAALQNREALARIWWEGTKWALVLTIPLGSLFLFDGYPLMTAWVGVGYSQGAIALGWLALGQALDLSQGGGFQVLLNSGRHRLLAFMMLAEAIVNFSLSIWLLHYYGIVGVAMGTTIPLAVRALLFYPLYLSHVTGMPLGEYVRRAVVPPVIAATPAVIIALAFRLLDRAATAAHGRGVHAGAAPIVYRMIQTHVGRPAIFVLILSCAACTAPCAWMLCLTESQRKRISAKLMEKLMRSRERAAQLAKDTVA